MGGKICLDRVSESRHLSHVGFEVAIEARADREPGYSTIAADDSLSGRVRISLSASHGQGETVGVGSAQADPIDCTGNQKRGL